MKRIIQWAVSQLAVGQFTVGSGSVGSEQWVSGSVGSGAVKPRLRNTAYCILKNSLLKSRLLNTAYCILKNSLLKPLLNTAYCILKNSLLKPLLNTAYCLLKTPFQNTAYCILLYFLLFFSQLTHAQIYPVQTVHNIVPPYSSKLSDYATSYDVKLRLRLILNDNNVNNRQVRLKLKIQGNGLNIQSRDIVAGAPFVYLNGGTSQAFTNVDLAAYFQLHNLIGINAQQYSRPLPDGAYKICWEVYDFQTNQLISNPDFGCDNVFLLLNDPPFLNLPNRGDQLTSATPFINFTWTPRHANATNVSYEFELREIWDTRIDPQAGFLAAPNYYTQTVFSTTLVYGIGQPELFPGKTYAWRVRAISKTGLSENSVFRNDGYSEIYYFTYTQACFPPIMTLAEPLSNGRVKISWQTHPDHNKYHVQYKRADVADAEWFEVFSYNNQTQIGNLQDGVTYDFRVGGTCHSLTDLDQGYSYSTPNQFTMPTADETVSYSCGIVPEIEISNTDPLSYLGENETFRAGDFPVTVTEVEGTNGTYSGIGFIVVPYLADTKIAVAFEGITINTDYQLIDGIIKTTYDPKFTAVHKDGDIGVFLDNIEEAIDAIGDLLENSDNLTEEEFEEKWKTHKDILNESRDVIGKTSNLPPAVKSELTELTGNKFLASTSDEIPDKKDFDTLKEELSAIKDAKEYAARFPNLPFVEGETVLKDEYQNDRCNLSKKDFKKLPHSYYYRGRKDLEVVKVAPCNDGVVYLTKKGAYLQLYYDQSLVEHYRLYDPRTQQWKEYTLGAPDCLSCSIEEGINDVLKFGGRWIVPLEDLQIVIDGKDFDQEEVGGIGRGVSAVFLVVDIVPGGKAITKPAKVLTKKVLKKTLGASTEAAIEVYVKNKRVQIGKTVNGALQPVLNWVTDISAKPIGKLENVRVWVNNKIETLTFEVVEVGSSIGLRRVVNTVGNRFFKSIDEFKAAIARGENVFYVGKHTDITPRPTGVQSHHGVNSVWMKAKYSNYSANKAPSVYMLNNPNHNATRGVFNTWAKEIRTSQGLSKVDYTKVTKDDILDLAKKQFDAADTPRLVRDEYYKLWDDYLKTLTPK